MQISSYQKSTFIDFTCLNRHTQIGLLPFLFAVLVISILGLLSVWQFSRATQKRVFLQEYSRAEKKPAIEFAQIKTVSNYQRVLVKGTFLNDRQFLLDNKFYQHKIGYQVITPFKLSHSNKLLLINRGWLAANESRQQLPQLQPVNGQLTLTGRIYKPNKTMLVFKMLEDNPGKWPLVIERIDFEKISQHLSASVSPFVIWLDADQPHGFMREWQPVVLPPQRHIAYAIQWFALMLTFSIAFIALHTKNIQAL